jgi:hypothetical protein
MLSGLAVIFRLVIALPGIAWEAARNFFQNSLRKWWRNHY